MHKNARLNFLIAVAFMVGYSLRYHQSPTIANEIESFSAEDFWNKVLEITQTNNSSLCLSSLVARVDDGKLSLQLVFWDTHIFKEPETCKAYNVWLLPSGEVKFTSGDGNP